MFNPNSIKTLRTMSASSQRQGQNKQLMDEIDNAIEELREWKKNENIELKKQLMENQQNQKIIYKSGYEIDDDEEDVRQEELLQQQTELNRKLQKIRQDYMKEYLQIPKYMSSKQKTNEVTEKLQKSLQRLENIENAPINKLDLNIIDDDILIKLTQWKSQLVELDEIGKLENSNTQQNENLTQEQIEKIKKELDSYQKEEEQISKEQLKQQEQNDQMKQELDDLDKDFDEIDSLLNQCGIK